MRVISTSNKYNDLIIIDNLLSIRLKVLFHWLTTQRIIRTCSIPTRIKQLFDLKTNKILGK